MVGGKVNVNRRKVSSLTTEEGLSSDESNVIEDPRPKYLTLSLFGPHQHQARPFLALTLNDLITIRIFIPPLPLMLVSV